MPFKITAEKLIWAERMLNPDDVSDDVQARGIVPGSNLPQTALTYYDVGKELQAACIKDLRATPVGQTYATTDTGAKLVPFAAEEEDENYASDGDEEAEADVEEKAEADVEEEAEADVEELELCNDETDEAMQMFDDGDDDEDDGD